MTKAGPRPSWEQLADSAQRIYLALAEGDERRARQLHDQERDRPRRRRPRPTRAPAADRPARDLRGFVPLGRRLVPRDMAAAEAWKRQQARQR